MPCALPGSIFRIAITIPWPMAIWPPTWGNIYYGPRCSFNIHPQIIILLLSAGRYLPPTQIITRLVSVWKDIPKQHEVHRYPHLRLERSRYCRCRSTAVCCKLSHLLQEQANSESFEQRTHTSRPQLHILPVLCHQSTHTLKRRPRRSS